MNDPQSQRQQRKKQLDLQRTQWRKTHRTLNGKIILYPDKKPEHISARASKTYNWFWKQILLEITSQEIPAVISTLKDRIKATKDQKKIQMYRTMISMAEDAYKLKQLEDIKDYDAELMLGKQPVYNAEDGVIYKKGTIYTTDYDEDETRILVRDIEGLLVDVLCSEEKKEEISRDSGRVNTYKNWEYTKSL